MKELKLKIEISFADSERVIWTDWALGTTKDYKGMIESAEETLGKMDRNLGMVLARDYKDDLEPTPEELKADHEFMDEERAQSEREAYRLAH